MSFWMRPISADFWHDTREELRKRHGKELFVFPQCSTAGDQSPHPLFRKRAEKIMEDRRGISRRQEIARRISNAVDDVLPAAKKDIKTDLVFKHATVRLDLPTKEPPVQPFYETDSV